MPIWDGSRKRVLSSPGCAPLPLGSCRKMFLFATPRTANFTCRACAWQRARWYSQTRRPAAILAADVAGYSRLIGADEEKHPGAFPLESDGSPDRGAFRRRSVRQRRGETELGCDRLQAPIARPQFAARRQPHGGQQMGVDIADAAPVQRFAFNELEHFSVRGAGRLRQVPPSRSERRSAAGDCRARARRLRTDARRPRRRRAAP